MHRRTIYRRVMDSDGSFAINIPSQARDSRQRPRLPDRPAGRGSVTRDRQAGQLDDAAKLQELRDEFGDRWRIWHDHHGWTASERAGIGQLPRCAAGATAEELRADIERLEAMDETRFTTGDLP